MTWKEFAKDYLAFSRRERIAILTICLLIILTVFAPALLTGKQKSNHLLSADTTWIAAAEKLRVREETAKTGRTSREYSDNNNDEPRLVRSAPRSGEIALLFEFDPNTLDRKGWEKLGLKDKTIHIIENYLNKGGHFYRPEDMKKIYGLALADYSRLEPYIRIKHAETGYSPLKSLKEKKEFPGKHHPEQAFDINMADTTMFSSLPGIGQKLAARIVSFRDKLGGFYSVSQVSEVYGLQDSVFQKIKQWLKLENNSIRKININTATIDELKGHPYIKYNLANPICSYRKEHGPFSKIEDIKKVVAVTEDIYNRLAPYLAIQ